MSKLSDLASVRFRQHLNCSQSVFLVFAVPLGMEEEMALRLASPFGGGVARRGEICGAVSGALLVLGLAHGSATPEGKEQVYRLSQEFMQKFEAKHPGILCRQLLGYDLNQPGEYQQAKEAGVFNTICPLLVSDAVEILQSMLETAIPEP